MNRKEITSLVYKAGGYYEQFDSNRIGTTKWRHIDNPVEPLKTIQKRIQRELLSYYEFPDSMFGGIKGRSSVDNAKQHIGKAVIVTLDLKSCFPKTKSKRILDIFKKYFGATDHIALLLTKLTSFRGLLPQGASTSSALANLTLLEMHNEIKAVTDSFGLEFTLFVDDLALSGERVWEAIGPVISIIQKYGHAVSNKKKKIMPKYRQQLVTGKVVNTVISFPKKKINETAKAIIGLSKRKTITLRQMQSVRTRIGAIKTLSPTKGIILEKLASDLLPEVKGKGMKVYKEVRVPCRNRNCKAIH